MSKTLDDFYKFLNNLTPDDEKRLDEKYKDQEFSFSSNIYVPEYIESKWDNYMTDSVTITGVVND